MEKHPKSGRKIVFTNGTIYIDSERKVKNLLVNEGKVQAYDVNLSEIKNTTIIDLKGCFAYPGFNDSHVHIMETFNDVKLSGCTDSDTIAEVLACHVRDLSEETPIIGAGFLLNNYDAWSLEDLAKIDNVTGLHPVIAYDQWGHNMFVNSATMVKCGITAETPAPMGGKMILQDGKPTGMLRESAMSLAGNTIFPLFDDDIIIKHSKKLFDHWSSLGYTSLVDLMGGSLGRVMRPDLLRKMEKDGVLPVRVNYTYTFYHLDEVDNAVKYIGRDTDMVRFAGLKIFIDGAFAAGQAWTTWKNEMKNNGLYFVYSDDTYGKQYNINRIVEKVNDLGLNIQYHMQGDNAIEAVLDALDAVVEKKGQLSSRHVFVHLAFLTDEQLERIKRFDGQVVATVQPELWTQGDLYKYYGDRFESCYPIKKLMDAGVSTGISTDFPASQLEFCAPTTIMKLAMTGAGDPVNHPPLKMKNLIQGFTVGSAVTTPIQDTGKLDIGYRADMVVYNKDLYSVSAEELTADNPKVISTWINGRKVYDSK